MFQHVMLFADWFDFHKDPKSKPDYVIKAIAQKSGDKVQLQVQVLDGKISKLHKQFSGTDEMSLYHFTVDSIIKAVFDNPGPCQSTIAFVKKNGALKEIWTSDFDGNRAKQLSKNKSISTEPNWSPKKRFLTYTLYSKISTMVIAVDVPNKRIKRLARYRGLNSSASTDQSNQYVAMALSKDGQVDLYLKHIMNNKLIRLTNSKAVEASPCWSPDNKQICFVSNQTKKPTLYVMPVKPGAQAQRLVAGYEMVSPDWSTVSNKICFAIRRGSEYHIAEINMNDSKRTPRVITKLAGDWESPSWLADGRHIVCSRKLGKKQSLYIVDSWYGNVRELKGSIGDGLSLPDSSD